MCCIENVSFRLIWDQENQVDINVPLIWVARLIDGGRNDSRGTLCMVLGG